MEAFAKDTDGFFARHFDRKISGAISRQLLKTPVTPNQITVFVTLLGVVAGFLMAQRGYAAKVEGSIVFLLTSILDGCDGEIARAKHLTSRLGGWLDLWGDNVVHVAVFYGLGLGIYRDTERLVYLKLGWAAVWGTLVSVILASYLTRRAGKNSFTSVSGDDDERAGAPEWRKLLVKMSDALARRDFVYGVVILALMNRLSWFLWACALGSIVYACVLGVLCLSIRPSVLRP
jgi:1L-myo-inositol 1-phosphate cytidylyltransferase / CDP-L-myo-inositol myo-inositolphosphotransferase